MATIAPHLTVEELGRRFRAAGTPTEARHVQAIWLLARGRTFVEVAEVVALSARWVEELAARYNAHGPGALGDLRRENGRAPALLTDEVLAALAERVRMPPDDGGVWSGRKVAEWIAARLKVEAVHPQRGWDALKKIGRSIQAPRPRHPRAATPEEQEAFKKSSPRPSPWSARGTPTYRSRSGPPTSTASA
jgi:transposase